MLAVLEPLGTAGCFQPWDRTGALLGQTLQCSREKWELSPAQCHSPDPI